MLVFTLYLIYFLLLIDLLLLFILRSHDATILLFYLLSVLAIVFLLDKILFPAKSTTWSSISVLSVVSFSGVLDLPQFLLSDLLMILPALSRFSDSSVSKVLDLMDLYVCISFVCFLLMV